MRNVVCILLFIVLCSNECNAPYKAKMSCRKEDCHFRLHDSMEFLMNGASVSWWRSSLEVSVFYRARNRSSSLADAIDYGRFSMVCSNGIKFDQAHREGGTTVHTYTPAASLDTAFLFVSADKYSKREGMEILKKARFYLLYGADTLVEVKGEDERMK